MLLATYVFIAHEENIGSIQSAMQSMESNMFYAWNVEEVNSRTLKKAWKAKTYIAFIKTRAYCKLQTTSSNWTNLHTMSWVIGNRVSVLGTNYYNLAKSF